MGGKQQRTGRLHLTGRHPQGGKRRRHHLLRRSGRRRTGADLHVRPGTHRRLRQRGQHVRDHPARLRHRRRHPGRHRGQHPAQPGPRRPPGPEPRRRSRLHPRRRPVRPGVRHAQPAQGRQEQRRQGQSGQHHDHGLRRRRERPQRLPVRGQGHRRTTGHPLRHLDRPGLRTHGPDPDRRKERRRRELHPGQRHHTNPSPPPTASRSCPSGKSTATTREPDTPTPGSSTRSPVVRLLRRVRRPPRLRPAAGTSRTRPRRRPWPGAPPSRAARTARADRNSATSATAAPPPSTTSPNPQ